ncbi:ABC transporter substrate-binding protein [Ahrensia marina]|uniref:ABC transporter substrate-binding protein n=1 Tax=Ahrensia marina TaxID=1514904 RepID=UPI0035D04FFF
MTGFNRIAIAAITTLGVIAGASSVAAQDVVRIGTEGAYPPFNFTDSDGNLVGFEIDLAVALCEEMDVTCEFVAQDWDGIIPALLANRYDAIMASMSITEERMEIVDFSDKYYQTPARFAVRDGSDITDTSPEALAGMTIGAQSATIHANFLEDVYSESDIRLYPTQDEANLDLAAGRIDLILADSIVLYEWMETDDGSCCTFVGDAYNDPAYFGFGVGAAVRQGDDELRERFNAAIAAVIENGTYQEISEKYFPFSVY